MSPQWHFTKNGQWQAKHSMIWVYAFIGFSVVALSDEVLTLQVAFSQESNLLSVRVGQQSIMYPDGFGGLHYFSDEPISILSTRPCRFLIVACDRTILMEGSALESAKPVAKVLEPGSKEWFDNGYAGISSVYRWNRELLAFYHAEDQVDMQRKEFNSELLGCYCSVGLATSKDGRTFTKVGQIITASLRKGEAKGSSQGAGDASVCADHTNTYLYAYYTDWTRIKGRPVVICMARCKISDGGRPGKWYKYFRKEFSEAGLGGKDEPVMTGPKGMACDAWAPHVTYVKSMKKYIMFFTVTGNSDQKDPKPSKTGVYFSSSEDGIQWGEPQLAFLMHCIPFNGREILMHPGFYPQREMPNSVSGWLIYSYSPRFGSSPPMVPHHLVRRPIVISQTAKAEQPESASVKKPEPSTTPAAKPSEEWKVFVGRWDCGDIDITLNEDFTALNHTRNHRGKWEYVKGEAHIAWNNGNRTVLRREGQGFQKLYWKAGETADSSPNPKWTHPAVKKD